MNTESSPAGRPIAGPADLLLQETIHRGGNDLQMIVGLLALQSRRAVSAEAKQTLTDAMERVSVLARARSALSRHHHPSLAVALQQVCTALQSQAEPRSILVALNVERESQAISPNQITTLALVVNELATNAIKHAYQDGKDGYILVTQTTDDAGVVVRVDDDGLPFPDARHPGRDGLGLQISGRLMASIGGAFLPPRSDSGSKVFELRVPFGVEAGDDAAARPVTAALMPGAQDALSLRTAIAWALYLADSQREGLVGALLADVLYLADNPPGPPA